jgi:hypothetical protein
MNQTANSDEIQKMPSVQSLTREERRQRLAESAQIVVPWYLEDKELTIFTKLDGDDIT